MGISSGIFVIGLCIFFGTKLAAQYYKEHPSTIASIGEYVIGKELAFEIASEFSLFVAAAGVVHLVYFFMIRRGEVKESRQITRDAIADLLGGIREWGFERIHEKIDFASQFEDLKSGDEVLWLDTLHPGFNESTLSRAVEQGAKVRILMMDTSSHAVKWRHKEIRSDNVHRIRKTFELAHDHFSNQMEQIKKECTKKGLDNFDFRKYRDLLGTPCLIILRKSRPSKAFSGFYLNRSSDDFMQIEWSRGSRHGIAPDNCGDMVDALVTYFNNKWETWPHSDLPDLDGADWKYEITFDHFPKDRAAGDVCIAQTGRELVITGRRTMRTSEPNRANQPIEWGTDEKGTGQRLFAEICSDSKVRFDYYFDKGAKQALGMCVLQFTAMPGIRVTELRGEYSFTPPAKNSGGIRASHSGTIKFTRS